MMDIHRIVRSCFGNNEIPIPSDWIWNKTELSPRNTWVLEIFKEKKTGSINIIFCRLLKPIPN